MQAAGNDRRPKYGVDRCSVVNAKLYCSGEMHARFVPSSGGLMRCGEIEMIGSSSAAPSACTRSFRRRYFAVLFACGAPPFAVHETISLRMSALNGATLEHIYPPDCDAKGFNSRLRQLWWIGSRTQWNVTKDF